MFIRERCFYSNNNMLNLLINENNSYLKHITLLIWTYKPSN